MFVRVNFDQPVSELVREFLTEDSNQIVSSEPAIDVSENENESVIVVELPGVKKEDIKISVENGWLTLSGERKSFEAPEITRVLHREIESKPFARSIKLPHRVDTDKISAQLENGLLKISLPKAEEVRPRTIEIK
jgi:Molecular chaperone (small heat shock protein)